MASVTITFTDNAKGDVDVALVFHPSGMDGTSAAHMLALGIAHELQGDEGDISTMEVQGHG